MFGTVVYSHLSPADARLLVSNSAFASRVAHNRRYALTRYRVGGDDIIRTCTLCEAPNVDGLAQSLFLLRDDRGDRLEISVVAPKDYDERYFPVLQIDGERRMLQLGHPSYCLNFAQPELWRTPALAQEHARKMPSMTLDEQAQFLSLLLERVRKS